MRHRSPSHVLPYVSILAGWALGAWRFRVEDALGGFVATYGSVALMLVLAAILSPGGLSSRDGSPERSPRRA